MPRRLDSVNNISKVDLDFQKPHVVVVHCGTFQFGEFYAGALGQEKAGVARSERGRTSGRISQVNSHQRNAVAGAVKETSQGTFAKGVDTKWPETQTVAKGVTSLLRGRATRSSNFNFKPPPRQETVSVPPRG